MKKRVCQARHLMERHTVHDKPSQTTRAAPVFLQEKVGERLWLSMMKIDNIRVRNDASALLAQSHAKVNIFRGNQVLRKATCCFKISAAEKHIASSEPKHRFAAAITKAMLFPSALY